MSLTGLMPTVNLGLGDDDEQARKFLGLRPATLGATPPILPGKSYGVPTGPDIRPSEPVGLIPDASAQLGPRRPTPAADAYEQLREQGQPQLHGIKKVFDVLGQGFAPRIEQAVPGSPGYYRRELGRAEKAAEEESLLGERQSTDQYRKWEMTKPQTVESGGRAYERGTQGWRPIGEARQEKPDNPEQQFIDDFLQRNPGKNIQDAVRAYAEATQKPEADKTPPHITVVGKDGKSHIMERDPNTGDYSIDRGEAPPTFAQTGLWDPTELVAPSGGLIPGKFNRRTGQAQPLPTANTPVPREAQKQIDTAMDTARNIDRLERAQQQILAQVEKRGQGGPAGGGPYMNGPESMQFLANHIALTMGTVKGARTGRDLIEQHVKARDLDQATEALAQGVLAGGVITHKQAQQMLETTRINREQAWKQAKAAATQYGVPDAVKVPTDLAGQGGGRDFGAAPTGKPEGSTGTMPDGTKVVIRGGRIVSQ